MSRITFEDTKLIRDVEGYSNEAYPDPATHGAPYTIGWGLTGKWVTKGLVMSDNKLKEKFMEKIGEVEEEVLDLLDVDVNDNQLTALVSFAYNCGINNLKKSSLLRLVNAEKFPQASNAFLSWDRAAGHVMSGLLRRREAERDLFLKPIEQTETV